MYNHSIQLNPNKAVVYLRKGISKTIYRCDPI